MHAILSLTLSLDTYTSYSLSLSLSYTRWECNLFSVTVMLTNSVKRICVREREMGRERVRMPRAALIGWFSNPPFSKLSSSHCTYVYVYVYVCVCVMYSRFLCKRKLGDAWRAILIFSLWKWSEIAASAFVKKIMIFFHAFHAGDPSTLEKWSRKLTKRIRFTYVQSLFSSAKKFRSFS